MTDFLTHIEALLATIADLLRVPEKAAARLEQERLKAQLAWRWLTREQHSGFVAALRGHPMKIWFQYSEVDPEALQYAKEIGAALDEAGMDVQATGFFAWGGTTGILVSPNGDFAMLRAAFTAAGVETYPYDEYPSGSSTGQIVLRVGSKPRPILRPNSNP